MEDKELIRRRATVWLSRRMWESYVVRHKIWYILGDVPPNYPVPSLYCFSLISRNVDPRACEMNVTNMLLSYLPERVT